MVHTSRSYKRILVLRLAVLLGPDARITVEISDSGDDSEI